MVLLPKAGLCDPQTVDDIGRSKLPIIRLPCLKRLTVSNPNILSGIDCPLLASLSVDSPNGDGVSLLIEDIPNRVHDITLHRCAISSRGTQSITFPLLSRMEIRETCIDGSASRRFHAPNLHDLHIQFTSGFLPSHMLTCICDEQLPGGQEFIGSMSLRRLTLHGYMLTRKLCTQIAGLSNLEILSLANCHIKLGSGLWITHIGSTAGVGVPRLTEIHLDSCQFGHGDSGLYRFIDDCIQTRPSLRVLT